MSERVERHVQRLADRVMHAVVSTLLQVAKTRLMPASLESIRAQIEEALREAATAGKIDTLHPPVTFGPDQSMIDTKPMRTRPPPLPKIKK